MLFSKSLQNLIKNEKKIEFNLQSNKIWMRKHVWINPLSWSEWLKEIASVIRVITWEANQIKYYKADI